MLRLKQKLSWGLDSVSDESIKSLYIYMESISYDVHFVSFTNENIRERECKKPFGDEILFKALFAFSHKILIFLIKISTMKLDSFFFATYYLVICSRSKRVRGDIIWPEYNQQCRDDAGPPYLDDSETFPDGGKYHDNSAAVPLLLQNGKCPDPLKSACANRPTIKTAFLEGPLSCGDKGWYCRIMPDTNWPPLNLMGDVNFGHCNTTAHFEDDGADQDGHCHGSSKDNTYYWWIRDHWFRGYNGNLRCCCGWNDGSETPLTGGRIANRCDYRRQVTPDEDVSRCRDANEDHNLSYEGGCSSQYSNQIGLPIPESDSMCWEVSRYGFSEGFEPPAPIPPQPPTPPVPTPPTPPPFPNPTCTFLQS